MLSRFQLEYTDKKIQIYHMITNKTQYLLNSLGTLIIAIAIFPGAFGDVQITPTFCLCRQR